MKTIAQQIGENLKSIIANSIIPPNVKVSSTETLLNLAQQVNIITTEQVSFLFDLLVDYNISCMKDENVLYVYNQNVETLFI